jgi:hypothetical protein
MTDRVEVPLAKPSAAPPPPPDGGTVETKGNVTRVSIDSEAQAPTPASAKSEGELLAGKYKTTEELVKGYKELEARLGQPKADPPPASGTVPSVEQATKIVQDAGLDMAKLGEEYSTKGGLTPETYKALESKGIPKATVDAYIDGQRARGEAYNNKVLESVGGKESFEAISKWAAANLSPAEVAEANAALSSMNEARAGLALAGIKARYVAANGSEPDFVSGEGARVAGIQPFESSEQLVEVMRDPRYKADPAFRAKVEARLKVSKMFGG